MKATQATRIRQAPDTGKKRLASKDAGVCGMRTQANVPSETASPQEKT